jgi:RHS repeat-associated protein
MTPGMTDTILLNVSGMDLLELITEINGNYIYDHTDWADARLIKYAKKEVGVYYLRARYYQPTTGRFISEDSIRSGLNWYTYCGGNPILLIDPSGLIGILPDRSIYMSDGDTWVDKQLLQYQRTGRISIPGIFTLIPYRDQHRHNQDSLEAMRANPYFNSVGLLTQ